MVRANSATDSPVAGRSGLDRGLRQLLKRTRHQPQLTPLKLARLLRIRDAYLEVFSGLAPHAKLVETLELACRVGKIARALTWARAVAQSDPDELDDHSARAPLMTLRAPRS